MTDWSAASHSVSSPSHHGPPRSPAAPFGDDPLGPWVRAKIQICRSRWSRGVSNIGQMNRRHTTRRNCPNRIRVSAASARRAHLQTAKDTSTRNTRAGFATWNGRYRLVFVPVDFWLGFAAMNDAERPTPELYREAAERLRQMARECRLPDIRGDLLDLSARFERMAAYFEAQRPGAPRDPPES